MSVSWDLAEGWFLHSAVGGGAILLIACLLLSMIRQPARRQAVGQWALVAALVAAGVCFFPAWLPTPWTGPPVAPQNAAPALQVEKMGGDFRVFAEERPALLVETNRDVVADEGALVDLLELTAQPDDAKPAQQKAVSATVARAAAVVGGVPATWQSARSAVAAAVAAVYLVGASFYLCRWLVGYLGLWRIVRSCVPAPPLVADLFDEMTRGRPGFRLLVSPRVQVPLSMGVLKPTIVLPASLCNRSQLGALRCVLAHELTHLKRRDALVSVLFALGQVVYFYVPWLGWLRRQVRLCQEYIADAAAVEHASCPADYAQFLLGLTAAPAAPAGAAGVSGNSSDLYRRINMLLQEPLRIDRRCPRLWSVGVASLFVIGGVLAGGVGRRAEAAPAPQDVDKPNVIFVETRPDLPADDDESAPKKERHAQRDRADRAAAIEALRKALDNLPEGEARDQIAQLKNKLEAQGKGSGKEDRRFIRVDTMPALAGKINNVYGFNFIERGRLGVFTEKPSPALVEQLDLPRGRGLVIERVVEDSPASKAGVKANDILLEIDGKDVDDDPGRLTEIIGELKANSPIEAVVLRRGRQHTIKAIVLPKAGPQDLRAGRVWIEAQGVGTGIGQGLGGNKVGAFIAPGGQRLGGELANAWASTPGRGVMITMFRTDDRFTGRHQEGSLVISVTGKVDDGKASISQIRVQDGGSEKKYDSIEKVPEEYRDKARNLIESAEKNASKVEVNHR